MNGLNQRIFVDEVRLNFATRQHSVIADYRIFVAYDVRKIAILAYNVIGHYYTVFNDRIPSDFNSAEKNAIFYGAFNNTAVGNKRVLNVCGFRKLCGCAVVYFCIYVSRTENLLPDFFFEQIEIGIEILVERRNAGIITFKFVPVKFISFRAAAQNIPAETRITELNGVLNEP